MSTAGGKHQKLYIEMFVMLIFSKLTGWLHSELKLQQSPFFRFTLEIWNVLAKKTTTNFQPFYDDLTPERRKP